MVKLNISKQNLFMIATRGVLLIIGYTGMFRSKEVNFLSPRYGKEDPFSGLRYVKGVPFQGNICGNGTFSRKGM